MIAYVVTTRFAVTPDGRLWNANGILGYSFWTRYLDVYDEVVLLGQTVPSDEPPPGWFEATGPSVRSVPLPALRKPLEAARNIISLRRTVKRLLRTDGAVHLRAPSPLADLVWLSLERSRPYGLEVAGDPNDSLAPGAYRSPLRPLFRQWFRYSLRRQCARAEAVAYVTESALQRGYPPGSQTYSTHFSSIDLRDEAFVEEPKTFDFASSPTTVITVGTQAQLYKAPHILIDAVAQCVRDGLDLRLVLVGDGKYRDELERQTAHNGIGDRTEFKGHLPAGAGVRAALDEANLFVLPSFQEGVPKALIEAMARGLPCIGSTAGGIPELLPNENLVEPGDVAALAAKLKEVVTNPRRMRDMAARNLRRAADYHIDNLRPRRVAFYERVERATTAWLASRR